MTSASFLIALRGTRVEVRNGAATAAGKVFSVETIEKETASGGTIHLTQLAIVTLGRGNAAFRIGPRCSGAGGGAGNTQGPEPLFEFDGAAAIERRPPHERPRIGQRRARARRQLYQ